jgi:hypothetical protein
MGPSCVGVSAEAATGNLAATVNENNTADVFRSTFLIAMPDGIFARVALE